MTIAAAIRAQAALTLASLSSKTVVLFVLLHGLATALRHRRDATMLAGLDDHMLKDIGLTRGDVRDAVSEPLWRDPTAILVRRVSERRAGVRRSLSSHLRVAPSISPDMGAKAAFWA